MYFKTTWFDGMFPVCMWNVYALEGPRTNNHAEGWHSKVQKLAGKAHPNIYEAVTLFQSEQIATEVSIMQLAAEGETMTIREKYEAGDYSLSELVKACSHFVIFICCCCFLCCYSCLLLLSCCYSLSLSCSYKKRFRRNGTLAHFVRRNGIR